MLSETICRFFSDRPAIFGESGCCAHVASSARSPFAVFALADSKSQSASQRSLLAVNESDCKNLHNLSIANVVIVLVLYG